LGNPDHEEERKLKLKNGNLYNYLVPSSCLCFSPAAAQPASRVASAGACVQHAPLLSVHGSAMGREPTPRGAIGRIEKLRETS